MRDARPEGTAARYPPWRRVVLGRPEDPAWARPMLIGLAVATAVLYTWALDVSGYANNYYSSAAYSASQSLKAWFFGAVDPASFITVDKPPLSIWVTGLSVRVFGLSPWSILLPQAAAGVATVLILYRTVRRWHGHAAGLIAAAVLAVTPVAVVMFRYNNPDAILTLLLVGSLALGYSAAHTGRLRTLLGAFALVGLAFLTKTSQALLVLPALGLTYLVAAPLGLWRRVAHCAAGVAVMVASAGWWIAVVELIPADARPYIGGTRTNSFLEYVLGYNGLGRILGQGNPGGDADPFGGGSGWSRLLNDQVGGQVSWLIPLALVGLAAGAWAVRRHSRTDAALAGWMLWGTAFATHAVAFSLARGVFHPYYTLAMAPTIAALCGAGVVLTWRWYRLRAPGAWLLPIGIAISGAWAATLLGRSPDFVPGLGTAVLAVSASAAAVLAVGLIRGTIRRLAPTIAVVAGLAVLGAGPAAYAIETLRTDMGGGDPKAGPVVAEQSIGPQAAAPIGGRPPLGGRIPDAAAFEGPGLEFGSDGPDGPPPPDGVGGGPIPGGGPVGGPPGVTPTGDGPPDGVRGAVLEKALIDYLSGHRGTETWLVAVEGAQIGAPLILETGEAVMTMGGFGGGDPWPTKAELAGRVEAGELRYVLLGAGRALVGPGGRSAPWRQWVPEHCAQIDPAEYGGGGAAVLYDCAPG